MKNTWNGEGVNRVEIQFKNGLLQTAPSFCYSEGAWETIGDCHGLLDSTSCLQNSESLK